MLIMVPDGYNGHMVALDTKRVVKRDGHSNICLMVHGSDYLIRWVRKEDFERLTSASFCCGNAQGVIGCFVGQKTQKIVQNYSDECCSRNAEQFTTLTRAVIATGSESRGG